MKPWTRSVLPGSRLGLTPQLGSMQPQPVGFNCCRCRMLCSGMQSGKQAFNPLCSQQTSTKGVQWLQRADGLDGSHRELAGGILVELGLRRGQEHSWCNAVDVSASRVQHRILICIFSWAHRAWHLVYAFVTAAVTGLAASLISPVPGKPTHEPISRALWLLC